MKPPKNPNEILITIQKIAQHIHSLTIFTPPKTPNFSVRVPLRFRSAWRRRPSPRSSPPWRLTASRPRWRRCPRGWRRRGLSQVGGHERVFTCFHPMETKDRFHQAKYGNEMEWNWWNSDVFRGCSVEMRMKLSSWDFLSSQKWGDVHQMGMNPTMVMKRMKPTTMRIMSYGKTLWEIMVDTDVFSVWFRKGNRWLDFMMWFMRICGPQKLNNGLPGPWLVDR